MRHDNPEDGSLQLSGGSHGAVGKIRLDRGPAGVRPPSADRATGAVDFGADGLAALPVQFAAVTPGSPSVRAICVDLRTSRAVLRNWRFDSCVPRLQARLNAFKTLWTIALAGCGCRG